MIPAFGFFGGGSSVDLHSGLFSMRVFISPFGSVAVPGREPVPNPNPSLALPLLKVRAFEVDQRTGERDQTNKLTFVFKPAAVDPHATQKKCNLTVSPVRDVQTRVIPRSYGDNLLYLEGRRVLQRLMGC